VYCGDGEAEPAIADELALARRERQPLEVREAPNAIWALDFMSDALYHGRRYRTLSVIDEGALL
jgi:hypothetical protein